MSAHIAVMKIMFIVRTLCLPVDSMYRQLLVSRIDMLKNVSFDDVRFVGPVLSCWECVRKYNLEDVVMPFVEIGDPKKVLSTKRVVKARVKEIEYTRWRYSCMFYGDLKMYLEVVTDIKPIVWWSFVQSHPVFNKKAAAVVSILMGGQPRGLQCNFTSDLCGICFQREHDDPIHILFVCDGLQEERELASQPLINSLPLPMLISYNNLSNSEKLKFMFSGVAKEYPSVMMCIANYIYALYQKRKLMYDVN